VTNVGLLPGLNFDGWRRYEPLFACAGTGGETQPVLDQQPYPFGNPSGRYMIEEHNEITVAIQMEFAGAGYSVGSGSAYVFRLPFPASRWTGKGLSSPVPLGLGMAYNSFSDPQITTPMIVTLADPFASLNGREDNYVQCYCPSILSWGSGALAAGSATVTHLLGYTPLAEDIEVVFTDATGTGTLDRAMHSIQNITSTTFDIKTGTTSAGHNMGYAWKVRGKPPTGSTGPLLSPTTPWDWTRTNPGNFYFGNIFLRFSYEPRR
jgi:hypothetical protein